MKTVSEETYPATLIIPRRLAPTKLIFFANRFLAANYSYDAAGNLTEKDAIVGTEVWLYGYDQRNQLVRVDRKSDGTNIDLTVEYKYDAWGNRTQRSADLDGDGIGNADVTKFALDGWDPAKGSATGLENFDVFADLANDGSLKTRYLRNNQVDGLSGRVDMTGSHQGQFWYLRDQIGSIRTVLDSTGAPVDALGYDAFGNITTETDASYRGRYAWSGREIEVEVDLQYNRARYYSPTIGRWISQDPMGFDAGDSNLYRYVNNAPTNYRDPSGLESVRTNFDWFYARSLWFDNYYLAHLSARAEFEVSKDQKSVNMTQPPALNNSKVNYGTAGLVNITTAPFNFDDGTKGFSISIAAASTYSHAGFWNTVGTYGGAFAAGGAGAGAAAGGLGFAGGPVGIGTVATGAGVGGGVGGAVGVVVGAGKWLSDFSDWNSTITVSYVVGVKDCKIAISHNKGVAPQTGNSSVAAVAGNEAYGKEKGWILYSRGFTANDLKSYDWSRKSISASNGTVTVENVPPPVE